jgi:cobalt-zinc-cadmium efflux system protein
LNAEYLHAHKRGDAEHAHAVTGRAQRWLWIALFLTLGFSAVELIAGLWASSLALISDAGHMVTDAAALGFSIASPVHRQTPTLSKTFFWFWSRRGTRGVCELHGDVGLSNLDHHRSH